ncbi:MAG TPA: hypothetical protein VJ867_01920 [Gemmatimonadaceae bacterium]|nr:hypothetical protein [Gemmatimonadaceae bacterium]
MPAIVAGLRYPYSRVMLPRTRLAYIHLKNLLTDAKRDRSARLSGYVAVWLPEEFVVLYLQRGEVANATILDAKGWRAVAISTALERIPAEPEYGEICFHEADDDQLAAMFAAQTIATEPWPADLRYTDPAQLFPFLMSIMFDGVLEIVSEGSVNYLRFRSGAVDKAYLSFAAQGSVVERVAKLFAPESRVEQGTFRRWSHLEALPVQAPPALVAAYRELSNALVQRLVAEGRESAPAIAEHARMNLVKKHPELAGFCIGQKPMKEPLSDTTKLTAAVASWLSEIMMVSANHEGAPPESLLKELTWERRHMFQSAGFYDKMPWKVM